jgi:hypothetical protein
VGAAGLERSNREFFGAVSDVVFRNPFSRERAALIARLLPDAPQDLATDREALARVSLRGWGPAAKRSNALQG